MRTRRKMEEEKEEEEEKGGGGRRGGGKQTKKINKKHIIGDKIVYFPLSNASKVGSGVVVDSSHHSRGAARESSAMTGAETSPADKEVCQG